MTQETEQRQGDAVQGHAQINWARRSMPLTEQAFAELESTNLCRIGIALSINPALCAFAAGLVARGHSVILLAHPASVNTQDLLAALHASGVKICETRETFLAQTLEFVLDTDGGMLGDGTDQLKGGTLAGARAADLALDYPVPAIDLMASKLVRLCALTHGIGQACVSGFLDITNLQIAGRYIAVLGYGAIGEGVAKYAAAYGGRVLVVESDPVKAAQARLDGYEVQGLESALVRAFAVFSTADDAPQFELSHIDCLPEGAFLCNAAANSLSLPFAMLDRAAQNASLRPHVTQHFLPSGRTVKLICDGLPLHIETGCGIAVQHADILMAAQLRCLALLASRDNRPGSGVIALPNEIESAVAAGI